MIHKWMLVSALFLATLHADIYYAKAEPFQKHLIKSNVAGKVVFADEGVEGRIASTKPIVLIDSEVDKKEYKRLETQIELLTNSVSNYKEVYEKRFTYYESIKNMRSKSKSNKDAAYYAQAAAKQSLNSALIELDNSKQALFRLGQQIKDKRIVFNSWYVYDLHVTKGEYVTMGSSLVTVADTSKIKLTLFLSAYDAAHVKEMDLFVNDKRSDKKMDQVWQVSDSEHLSSYEAKLILPRQKQLSQLVKVELRKKSNDRLLRDHNKIEKGN